MPSQLNASAHYSIGFTKLLEIVSSLWRTVFPDYKRDTPSYVPTLPTNARQDGIKAKHTSDASKQARDLASHISARTVTATDDDRVPDTWLQMRLIEDTEELVAKLKEACPLAAERLKNFREQQREMNNHLMRLPDENSFTTMGREIAMDLADELPEATRMAVTPGVCADYKNEVIQKAKYLIKAVKMTHPLLSAGDILSDSDEEGRPAKRAKVESSSDNEEGRPAKRTKVESSSSSSDSEEASDSDSDASSYGHPASASRVFRVAPGSEESVRKVLDDMLRRLRDDA